MIFFLSDFVAEHMFIPFSQVSSDSKPVEIAGKGREFSTNQHWNKTSRSDFEPISIAANRNLFRQAWFPFLNFVFQFADNCLDCWKCVCVNMMQKPLICVSKLKSLCNRPTVVGNIISLVQVLYQGKIQLTFMSQVWFLVMSMTNISIRSCLKTMWKKRRWMNQEWDIWKANSWQSEKQL